MFVNQATLSFSLYSTTCFRALEGKVDISVVYTKDL